MSERATAVSLAAHLEDEVEALRKIDVTVIATVADNCSTVQLAGEIDDWRSTGKHAKREVI